MRRVKQRLLGVFVRPYPKECSTCSGALYQAVRHKCVTAAPARAIALAGTALLLTVSLPTLVLSRNSAEKFFGFAQQIFRALDNDVSLKSKHARSGLPLRAFVALSPAEHRSADFVFPADVSAGTVCVFIEAVPHNSARTSDGDILASDKEKPSRTRGAYFSVRDSQGGRALTQYHAK